MSPNCWRFVEDAVRSHPDCRYLEWGSGNSTIAVLRLALANRDSSAFVLHSIENNRKFANAMVDAIAKTFQAASVEGVVRVEPIRFSKPSLLGAFASDKAVARYEAHFLRVLWNTRNDRFWVLNAETEGSHAGRGGALRRRLIALRCSAAFRWQRLQRALQRSEPGDTVLSVGTIQSPNLPRLKFPARVIFETERVRLEFLLIPQLRNWLWHRHPILDGLYREFADYVSAPLDGQFDVVLVDGRARTSCLKRVHHDDLLAPGGTLFLHDAHRLSQYEGLLHFPTWSYVRGSNEGGGNACSGGEGPAPPLVRSGSSTDHVDTVFDRELYFYEAPIAT